MPSESGFKSSLAVEAREEEERVEGRIVEARDPEGLIKRLAKSSFSLDWVSCSWDLACFNTAPILGTNFGRAHLEDAEMGLLKRYLFFDKPSCLRYA